MAATNDQIRKRLWRPSLFGVSLLVVLIGCHKSTEVDLLKQPLPEHPNAGVFYLSDDLRALQQDPFSNPGLLWVDRGKTLFHDKASSPSCATCHTTEGQPSPTEGWRSAATRYPTWDKQSDQLINLEQRINLCRERYQGRAPLKWESEPLLALTSYVAHQSAGAPIRAAMTPQTAPSAQRGERYFYTRRGQLNLACSHCHELNPGQYLRGDRLSEGMPTGYPAYKLDWQGLGSLQRRLRDCDIGVRAEPYPFGAQPYVDLELYLKLRAGGLAVDTPAVRR